tara:strand:- start:1507 stop:2589 length:1083 start_codon:yes stop_codon:yes gene_type:complete
MRAFSLVSLALIASGLLFSGGVWSQPSVEVVYRGLDSPWGMAEVAPGKLLISEKGGHFVLVDVQSGDVRDITGAPKVVANGQGGLLDVAVPRNYKPGGWIYFTYSAPVQGEAATALARAKLNLKSGMLTDRQTLLVTTSISDTSRHFGSRIAFDDDHVFFTVGDRGVRENGQDLKNHAGTVIRLKRDGSVPDDNPFVGDGAALDEIWSYGHRNAQGIAFDAEGRLWAIEHGPRGGDELNLISKGENYGWPVVSQGKEYWGPFDVGVKQKEGMQPAAKVYVPSIAPGSLISVRSDKYGWKDDLLSGALKLTHFNRIVMQEGKPVGEERYFEERGQRLRALLEDSEGVIFIATDAGELWRLD